MSHASASDEALMSAFARGDETAYAELVHRHGAPLKAYALRLLRNAEQAEDVFVDTFLRVARDRAVWQPTGSVRGWLFTIAHRICLDLLRKRRRDQEREPQIIAFEASRQVQASPEAAAEVGELADALELAIAELPVGHREVVLLRLVHGLTGAETAAVVGLDEEQVRSQLSYARKRIRAALEAGRPAVGARARRSG